MDNIKSLLPIEEREDKQLINARVLYEFLDPKSRFNDWIRNRIGHYGFVKDDDYVRFYSNFSKTQGGRPTTDYGLTLDMAKEICMVDNTAKGRQARRYFIECEKIALKRLPTSYPEALRELAASEEAKLLVEKKLEIAAPKARDFDVTMAAFGAIGMDVAAAIINHPNLGRTNLFRFLRNEKVLKSGTHPTVRNTPYASYSHHFKVVLKRCGSASHDETRSVTLVKASGISFIIGRIERAYGRWVGSPSKENVRRQVEAYTEEEKS
jgi:anti-repressor protein